MPDLKRNIPHLYQDNDLSDNARYMALGNSIAVPCAGRVFIGIKKAESEE